MSCTEVQPYKGELLPLWRYKENEPETWADPEKRAAAVVFRDRWQQVKEDADYQRLKERHVEEVYDAEASPM